MSTRVFLALDNRLLRESLARLLRSGSKGSAEVCGVSPCTVRLSEAISIAHADVLVTELGSAAYAQEGGLRQISDQLPEVKILIVDLKDDERAFIEAVRGGAIGFLLRDCSAADVLTAVRALARGEAFCPPRFCLTLLNHIAQEKLPAPSVQVKLQLDLTRRQQQIVPLLAKGLSNKEIAFQLNLSEQTVKNHVHSMLRRTGARDRLAVAELARNNWHMSEV